MTPPTKKEFKLRPSTAYTIFLGCDPELFISKDGEVVGSDTVVPESPSSDVIRDGVQVELNPSPDSCRERLASRISVCMMRLRRHINTTDSSITVVDDVTVRIKKKNFDKMSPDCKKFGCSPSFRIHSMESIGIDLDPEKYLYRSAGGHIHLGSHEKNRKEIRDVEKTIPMLDAILGNTAVMLDVDKGNVTRRKHYGQAGEYRLPEHGIEYRTLSNFWMKSPVLFSLTHGLARQAVRMAGDGYLEDILEEVPMENFVRAINTNNQKLAKKNFDKIKHIIIGYANLHGGPINQNNIQAFENMVTVGIKDLFTESMMHAWTVSFTIRGVQDYLNDNRMTLAKLAKEKNG